MRNEGRKVEGKKKVGREGGKERTQVRKEVEKDICCLKKIVNQICVFKPRWRVKSN